MRYSRSIRSRRTRKKFSTGFDLQITSLLDILVILLVFLLKSASVSVNSLQAVPGIQIPVSFSQDVPPDTLQLVITPTMMTFENQKVLDFEPDYKIRARDLDEAGLRIAPLFDILTKAKERAEVIRAKSTVRDESGNPLPFEGVLAIQADKQINYNILRRVMYTSGTAGFKVFRFLAMKKEDL